MRTYPPILKTALPVFDVTKNTDIPIFFAIPPNTDDKDITRVQVTVRYQDTNQNALDPNIYPIGIKECYKESVDISEDVAIASTDSRFFIKLKRTDFTKKIEPNRMYILQLRFSTKTSEQSISQPTLEDINHDQEYYSEWSTPAYVKGVIPPEFFIQDFGKKKEDISYSYFLESPDFTCNYKNQSDGDYLSKWRLVLWNGAKTKKLYDTGFKGVNYNLSNSNQEYLSFETHLPLKLVNEGVYNVDFEIESAQGFHGVVSYPFFVILITIDEAPADLKVEMNNEEGVAIVKTVGGGQNVNMNLTLRRSSSKSNFEYWEDIGNTTIVNNIIDWTFCDVSCETGVWYRYGVQIRDNRGRRGMLKLNQEGPLLCDYENTFLTEIGGDLTKICQLKLKYNYELASYEKKQSFSMTETLGSQYPFFRRNGELDYKIFNINATIHSSMENGLNLFTRNCDMYDNNKSRYDRKRIEEEEKKNAVTYDYVEEHRFKQRVEDFLTNGKPKLLKSCQEGQFLVMLTDVNFSPLQGTDRLVYSFSAVAKEIAPFSLEKIDYYGIQKVGTYQTNIFFDELKLGQLNCYEKPPFYAKQNIIELVKKKYHFQKVWNGNMVNNFQIRHFKVTFESDPYPIYQKPSGELIPVIKGDTKEERRILSKKENLYLGWIMKIQDQQILISPPNNIYELKGEYVNINKDYQISFPVDTVATIDYLIELSKAKDYSKVPIRIKFTHVIGQIFKNCYGEKTDIIREIKNLHKYHRYTEKGYRKVRAVKTLDIEAEPGTVFYVKESIHKSYDPFKRVVVNETGVLYLDPSDEYTYFKKLYIGGKNINLNHLGEKIFISEKDGKELFKKIHDKGTEKPTLPKVYDYYDANGETLMFYNGKWRVVDKKGGDDNWEIKMPMEVMLNYYIVTEEGEY